MTNKNNSLITSRHNPRIKQLARLKKARNRARDGLILVEGYQEIKMAEEAGLEITTLYYSPDLANDGSSPDKIMNREKVALAREVFGRISFREHPDGFLALVRPRTLSLNDIRTGPDARFIVLEAVEKPGNLGAVLRTADAAGLSGVLLCDSQTDIYGPNVVRASLGAVFACPVASLAGEEAIQWLRGNRVKIYAATPEAKRSHFEVDYSQPHAIVVGAEHEGLSPAWLRAADEKIRIPMQGRVDSLNASVSAAVVVYEAYRQRCLYNK